MTAFVSLRTRRSARTTTATPARRVFDMTAARRSVVRACRSFGAASAEWRRVGALGMPIHPRD